MQSRLPPRQHFIGFRLLTFSVLQVLGLCILVSHFLLLGPRYSNARDGSFEDLAVASTTPVREQQPVSKATTEDPPRLIEFDLVYCVNLPQDLEFYRIDYVEIDALFQETIRRAGKDVRVHLLSNDKVLIQLMKTTYPHIYVFNYEEDELSNRAVEFREGQYIHQSVNPNEMEMLCMWRWILTADYFASFTKMTNIAPEFIFALDTDVVLLQAPALLLTEWKLQHWKSSGFECHQIASGAAMIWSLKGLESFTNFLVNAYRDKPSLAAHVKEWGATFPFCRAHRSLLIPCDGVDEMWHLSDMDVLRAWFLQNPTVRTKGQEERCKVIRQARKSSNFTIVQDAQALVGALPGEPAGSVCLVHFQGRSKKLIQPFRDFIHNTAHKKRSSFTLP